jgi:hypothetical protein
MADHGALRDAAALLEEASKLMSRIEREIRLMSEACAAAEADLERLERLAAEGAEHVTWLGEALVDGRRRLSRLGQGLDALAGAGRGLDALRLAADLAPPALTSLADSGDRIAVRQAAPPVLRRIEPETLLRAEPRPQHLAEERWDLLAADFPSFEESFAAALELLGEAEKQSERAAAGRRERERSRATPHQRTPARR